MQGNEGKMPSLPPTLVFVLAVAPFFFLVPLSQWLRRRTQLSSQEIRGILSNAILFAAIHENVWPSPIPLFVLALGLCWLTIRTRSVIPAMVLHALFNGVAVVYLHIPG